MDPQTLTLSQSTKLALRRWTQDYDSTLDAADPTKSGFETPEVAAAFNEEGRRLWDCLRKELPEINIVYFDNELGRVLEAPLEKSR